MQQITINLTDEQQAVVDAIYNPFVKAVPTAQPQQVEVYSIKDDVDVVLYVIRPDGTYTQQALNGLGQGWTTYGPDGEPIEVDEAGDPV